MIFTLKAAFAQMERELIRERTKSGLAALKERGVRGTYQHCKERHLHRYLAEFDFRFNARQALGVNDVARSDRALTGIVCKRLTYQTTRS